MRISDWSSDVCSPDLGLFVDAEMRLARLSMTLRHALGPTADAARALARYQTRPAPDAGQAIRRLPVAALALEHDATTALVRAGMKTIGDLATRPIANLAELGAPSLSGRVGPDWSDSGVARSLPHKNKNI